MIHNGGGFCHIARKQLLSIDTRYRKAISEKVNQLETFPVVTLDIKKLHSVDNQYKLRVGGYRIIVNTD